MVCLQWFLGYKGMNLKFMLLTNLLLTQLTCFIYGAIVDHDNSSKTSLKVFHGIYISIIQFVSENTEISVSVKLHLKNYL